MKTSFKIPQNFLEIIFKQAEAEYPYECCGMILGPVRDPTRVSRIQRLENAQDKYHKLDPQNFPRDARTAYFIDSSGLLKIQKENRVRKEEIRVIYHSHIDAGAYFSEEDTRIALSEGEPAYPGVSYLVVSVVKRKVEEANLFEWNPRQKKFVLSASSL